MKHKTLFRVLIKAIGVWLVGQGIAAAAGGLSSALQMFLSGTGIFQFDLAGWWLVSPLAQIGIGLYLFFRGGWIADLAIPSDRPYCQECGYDLSGNTTGRCPECGVDWSKDYSEEKVRPVAAVVDDATAEKTHATGGSIARWVPWIVMGTMLLIILWGLSKTAYQLLGY